MLRRSLFIIFSILFIYVSYSNVKNTNNSEITNKIIVGAESIEEYKHLLVGKNVGIVANHTSVIFKPSQHNQQHYTHIVDSLLKSNVNIKKIFTPEHGYKGEKPNGANISDNVDKNTRRKINKHEKTKSQVKELGEKTNTFV